MMSETATPFDLDAPQGMLRPIIRYKTDGSGRKEYVNAHWGTNPRFADGAEYRFIRSEGKTFPSHRCLVPLSEFHMKVGSKRFRVTLEDGNWFYVAGVWEPAMAGWPLSFKFITVAANTEVSRYQERHGAIILRRQVMDWLDGTVAEMDLLATPPAHMFLIEQIGGRRATQETLTL